ncbi:MULTISPECIES: DUF4255 domain-containing protein [Aquimarina]|uniref:DUF4255 domain-containing protein n=1 Tax=Aquimarina algiphila TaxID=2047982 RepID=A0A554VPK6_9FLAO|nr:MULTISPECIES: DUF4255 domain-containing protein [Aquimarina]TSE10400.1 DUF4255 domain-containing protein [Aquimarina algiphila]
MIRTILQLLVNQLTSYILQVNEDIEEPPVVLGNIGLSNALGGSESYMQDKIVLSLVNLIEETTMKNSSPYRSASFQPEVENPPIFVNLFLLFTSNFTSPQGAGSSSQIPYNNGITLLSTVIEFFQSQNIFTAQNSPAMDIIQNPSLQDIRIAVDLYPLTFEQVNHLWGSLGGKQMPFVMYKARVLPLKREKITARGGLIQDVQTKINHIHE